MARQATYGKKAKKSQAARLFAELPQSPLRKPPAKPAKDALDGLVDRLAEVSIHETPSKLQSPIRNYSSQKLSNFNASLRSFVEEGKLQSPAPKSQALCRSAASIVVDESPEDTPELEEDDEPSLRILSWEDVCPLSDGIEKIAEASSAEVYRVSNDRGTSIIKVIRLHSPIKAQTKTQVLSKLIDEQPHSEDGLDGELQISQWLADIPGFVSYKERYIVQGRATRQMLETHQKFHRRLKRQDPGRAQFYPSPSRYLADTKFLVVELGDAGTALEDWTVDSARQLWDIFFLVAIALARAEDMAMFEVRIFSSLS